MNDYFEVLEKSLFSALETYSNVHRGSGHFSVVSTMLYEEARNLVLDYLELEKNRYDVVFCSPLRAADLKKQLRTGSCHIVSSEHTGINTGVLAVAIKKKELPKGTPVQAGGGTTLLVSANKIAWADAPDRYEAGTPALINVIALARSLQLIKEKKAIFRNPEESDTLSAANILHSGNAEYLSGKALLTELKRSVIGRNIKVPVLNGTSEYINLDYAASTPALYPVWDVYRKVLKQSKRPDPELSKEVKLIIAGMVNAPGDLYDVTFTSNTTEAINIASMGLKDEVDEQVILLSYLEHNSNDLPWRIYNHGTIERIKVDSEGFIDTSELEKTLSDYNEKSVYGRKRIRLMAVSGSSNVLGTCNDLEKISRIVHRYGAGLLVDAAQLIAHRETDMEKCGIDFLVFSGHKAYAPFGTGVLVSKKGMLNFSNERWNEIKASGEENIAGIAALGKSLLLLQRVGLDLIMNEEHALTIKALSGMSKIDGLKIFGIDKTDPLRSWQRGSVISFSLKKVWPDKIAKALASEGIGIRFGCHCAHLLVKHLLHVGPRLERFQFIIAALFPGMKFPGVARASFGIGTTGEDIERFINILIEIKGSRINSKPEMKTRMNDFYSSVRNSVFGI